MNKKAKYLLFSLFILLTIPDLTYATGLDNIVIGNDPTATVDSVRLLIFMTVLTLIPSILIMTTAFTRIIVTLSFLRSGLGSQQTPPNQILIGLALFLTIFIMQPTIQTIKTESFDPFTNNEITQEEAIERAEIPMKEFMLKQTREKDIALFLRVSNNENVNDPLDLPISVVIPAFAISELRTAFSIGFIIYIPFLVIDMVVASILMSMGMFMLPPVLISLPFKLLLFVLVDGWYLIVESLVESFI